MDRSEKSVLNKLLKGAGFATIGIFLSKAMGYLYRIIVGRYIGPEAYGQLAIGIMVLGFARAFSGSDPMDSALKKFIPEYREQEDLASIKGITLSTIHISLGLSIIFASVIFISADFIAAEFFKSPNLANIIRIFGIIGIIKAPYDRIVDASLGFNTTKYEVLTKNILQNIIKISLTLILVFLFGFGLMGAVWAWMGAVLLSSIAAFYFLERKVGPVLTSKVKPKYQHRKVALFGYPLMLSGVISTAQGWIDTGLIGYFMSNADVGFYNAAFPTAMLIMIPSQALGSLALSSISELGGKKEKSQEKALKTLTNWSFALVFPAFLLMVLFSEQAIKILFGAQYRVAATALSILAFSNLVSATVGNIGSYLQSKGHNKIIFYNTAITVVFNIGLNIYLIPKFGITGAAIATGVSSILAELFLFIETYRHEKVISLHPKMIKTIISGLTSIAVIYFIIEKLFVITPYWVLPPAAVLFFTLHFLIFLKTGGLTEYDKEIVLTLARKFRVERELKKALKILA
jgi:O-antigen/teichoic acid export membrane protein